jgi:hypothetical protein
MARILSTGACLRLDRGPNSVENGIAIYALQGLEEGICVRVLIQGDMEVIRYNR